MKTPLRPHSHIDEPFAFAPPALRKIAPYFLFIVAVFIAYGNVYDNAFLYDDESLILKNIFLRDWHYLGSIFSLSITAGANIAGGFYRPMQMLLYFFIYQAVGPSAFAFHLLNIVLHAANACLMYRLGCKLRFSHTAVFFATLIWAMHPVHTEIITYMSGTADPLYVFFSLLGILTMAPRFEPKRILASIPFFALALLSKEEAVVFPLLAMSCIFLLDRGRLHPKAYLRTWPLWLVAALYCIWHEFFSGFGNFDFYRLHDIYATSIPCRVMTCLATLPSYLGFLVWPIHLHFDRDFKPVLDPWHLPVMEGVAMVAIAMAQLILGRNRRALAFSWGLLWFASAHVLHTGIIKPLNAVLLEHWMYLPSIGLFLGTAQSLASVKWQRKQRKPAEMAIALLAALILGAMTYEQNTVWRDPESLYLNVFKNGEPSPHAHNNLGVIYAQSGRYQQALEQYELSIELSGDRNPEAQHDLAITLLNGPESKRYVQEAMMHLQKALAIDPDYYPASEALAVLYEQGGDAGKAAFYHQKAAESRAKIMGQ